MDRVSAAVDTTTKKAFNTLETATGITYNPDGLLYDSELRPFIDVIASTTFDWMRVFLCFGGVMQFESFLETIPSSVGYSVQPHQSVCHSVVVLPGNKT